MTKQRVLVTGGGGFLGQYIVEAHLERGDEVRTFSRSNYDSLTQLGVEQFSGDLAKDLDSLKRACEGVEVVHHTAALAGIWGKWETYFGINTLGTDHVIEACRTAGVSKLVYTSSPSVTFDGSAQEGVSEAVGYASRFNCNYPKSKALAERAVLAANEPGGLLTCALRPHLIWGPRDQHLIPRLIERAKSGQLRRVGDGSNLIDTIFVENAATAQLQAADALADDSPVAGNAYFLSQGEPVKCWEWIDEILGLAGLDPLEKGVSYPMAYVAGSIMEFGYWLSGKQDEPRMTRFLAAQLAKPHYFDISAAKTDFGYEPRISQSAGMDRLREWLEEQGQ